MDYWLGHWARRLTAIRTNDHHHHHLQSPPSSVSLFLNKPHCIVLWVKWAYARFAYFHFIWWKRLVVIAFQVFEVAVVGMNEHYLLVSYPWKKHKLYSESSSLGKDYVKICTYSHLFNSNFTKKTVRHPILVRSTLIRTTVFSWHFLFSIREPMRAFFSWSRLKQGIWGLSF